MHHHSVNEFAGKVGSRAGGQAAAGWQSASRQSCRILKCLLAQSEAKPERAVDGGGAAQNNTVT